MQQRLFLKTLLHWIGFERLVATERLIKLLHSLCCRFWKYFRMLHTNDKDWRISRQTFEGDSGVIISVWEVKTLIDDGDIDVWLEKFIDIRSVENYSHYHCHAQTEDTNNKHVETSLHHRVVLEPGLNLPVLHAGVAGHEEVGEYQPAGEGDHQVDAPVRQILGLKRDYRQSIRV